MRTPDLNKLKTKAMHSMNYCFALFALCLISDLLGFKTIGQFFFYMCFISFFYGMYHMAIFVYHFNKEGVKRVKEGKTFFDESLLGEEKNMKTKINLIRK